MKKQILVDVKIECEPPGYIGRWYSGLEKKAKEMEDWAREFEDFVRDHRSQDPISLDIVREYSDICEYCLYEWEEDDEGVPVCCGDAIDEYNNKTKKVAEGQ